MIKVLAVIAYAIAATVLSCVIVYSDEEWAILLAGFCIGHLLCEVIKVLRDDI